MQDGGECGGGGVGGGREMDSYIYEIYFAEITWMMGGLVMTILLKKEWNRISTIYILPKYLSWGIWVRKQMNRIFTIYISPKYP